MLGTMHRCFDCDPANSDRTFRYDDAVATMRVPARFVGPPGAANGGIAIGLLACPALRESPGTAVARITARLRRPLPVGRDLAMSLERDGDRVRVTLGGDAVSGDVELIHEGARPPLPDAIARDVESLARIAPPDAPPFWQVTGEHPIPGCFSCGPEHQDGLRIFPRAVADGVVCAPWTTAAEFARDGAIATSVLTSAIDCSSGICMPLAMQRELLQLDQFFLLGSLDVRYLRDAPPDRDYRVAARSLRRDGRKFFGLAVLADGDGRACAMAEATWIIAGISRTAAFGARS
jgi:hypothetical protein